MPRISITFSYLFCYYHLLFELANASIQVESGDSLINAIEAENSTTGDVIFDIEPGNYRITSTVKYEMSAANSVTLRNDAGISPQNYAACYNLPKITFNSTGADLYFLNTNRITYQGLAFFIDGRTRLKSGGSLTSMVFKDCCFIDANASLTLSKPFALLSDLTTLSFTNCIFFKRSDVSVIVASNSAFQLVNSYITYQGGGGSAENPIVFLQGSSNTDCSNYVSARNMSVTGLTIRGNLSAGNLPPMLVVMRYNYANIANTVIANLQNSFDQVANTFKPDDNECSSMTANGAVILQNINGISITNFSIANSSFQANASRSISWFLLRISNFVTLSVSDVMIVKNVTWDDQSTTTDTSLLSGLIQITKGVSLGNPVNSNYPSLSIANSRLSGAFFRALLISDDPSAFQVKTPQTLNTMSFSSIAVENTTIAYALAIVEVEVFRNRNGIDTTSLSATISILSCKITSSSIASRVISFTVNEQSNSGTVDYIIESSPYIKISLTNFNFTNSSFSKGASQYEFGPLGLISVCESALVTASGFAITRNTLTMVALIQSIGVVGNLLLTKSNLSSNTFTSSYLVYQAQQYLSALDYHSAYFLSPVSMYTLIRPMFISNIISQQNTLVDSTLFRSCAPFLFIVDSAFREYSLKRSTIATTENFQQVTNDELEEMTFSNYDAIGNSTLTQSAGGVSLSSMFTMNFLGEPLASQPLYFLRFERLDFSVTQPMESTNLISITDYQFTRSFVYFADLWFEHLTAKASALEGVTSAIMLKNINNVRVINNVFCYLSGALRLVTASSVSQSFEFISNNVQDGSLAAGVSVFPQGLLQLSQINSITLSNNTFSNISQPSFAISIGTMLSGGSIIIDGNTFSSNEHFGFLSIESPTLNSLTMSSNVLSDFSSDSGLSFSVETSIIVVNINELQGNISVVDNSFTNFTIAYLGNTADPLNFFILKVVSTSSSAMGNQIDFINNTFHNGTVSSQSTQMTAFLQIAASKLAVKFSGVSIEEVGVLNANQFVHLIASSLTLTDTSANTVRSDASGGLFLIFAQSSLINAVDLTNLTFASAVTGAAIGFTSGTDLIVFSNITVQNLSITMAEGGKGGIISIVNGNFDVDFNTVSLFNNSATGPIVLLSQSNFGSFSFQSLMIYTAAQLQTIISVSASTAVGGNTLLIKDVAVYEYAGASSILFLTSAVNDITLTNNSISPVEPTVGTNSSYLLQYSSNVIIKENFNSLILQGANWITIGCTESTGILTSSLTITQMTSSYIQIQNPSASFIGIAESSSTCSIALDISSSNFIAITKVSGNGSVITLSPEPTFTIRISDSGFQQNQAGSGGVFYSANNRTETSITITNCQFNSNSAALKGGVGYVPGDYIVVSNSVFDSNSAYIGGACFYVSYVDKLKGNLCKDGTSYKNSRVTLGKQIDIATDAHYFTLTMDEHDLELNRIISSTYPNGTLYLKNVSHYGLQTVKMQCHPYDYLDQPFYDYDFVNGIIFTILGEQNRTATSFNCTADQCYVGENNIAYLAGVGETVTTLVSYVLSSGNLYTSFGVQIRACTTGEVVDPVLKVCFKCPRGKYSIRLSDTQCSECPSGASCPGGDQIIPLVDYYRSHAKRDSVLKCSSGVCLGGEDNCTEGYYGPLCGLCQNEKGYVNQPDGTCKKCPDGRVYILVTALMFLANFLFQMWVVYGTWKNNRKVYNAIAHGEDMEEDSSMFVRQITVYFQIISIVGVSAPNLFEKLNFLEPFSNPIGSTAYFTDCIFLGQGYEAAQIMKAKIFIMAGMPFMKWVVYIFILLFLKLFKKGLALVSAVVAGGLTIFIGDQPAMLDELVSYLGCSQLDTNEDTKYVTNYMNVVCGTDDYDYFVKSFIYTFIFSFNLLIPLALLIVLIMKRKALNEESKRMSLGTIYNDYKADTFYWTIVLVVFKILLVIVMKLLDLPLTTKCGLLLLLIFMYCLIFLRKNPYYSINVARCEKVAVVSYMASVTIAIMLQQDNSTGLQVFLAVCFYLNTTVGSLFIMYFIGRNLFQTGKELFHKVFKKKSPQEQRKLSPDLNDTKNMSKSIMLDISTMKRGTSKRVGSRVSMRSRGSKSARRKDNDNSTDSFLQTTNVFAKRLTERGRRVVMKGVPLEELQSAVEWNREQNAVLEKRLGSKVTFRQGGPVEQQGKETIKGFKLEELQKIRDWQNESNANHLIRMGEAKKIGYSRKNIPMS